MTTSAGSVQRLIEEFGTSLERGDLPGARAHRRKATQLLRADAINSDQRIELLNLAARYDVSLGRPRARMLLDEAVHISEEVNDAVGLGISLMNIGVLESRRGRRREAADVWLRALAVFYEVKDWGHAFQTSMNLLSLLIHEGDTQSAERILDQFEHQLGSHRDPHARFSLQLARGQHKASLGDFNGAARSFRRALVHAIATREEPRIAAALQNLAASLLDAGRPKIALRHIQRAASLPSSLAPTHFRVDLLRTMALTYMRVANHEEVERALAEARRIAARLGDDEAWADATADLGGLRLAQRRFSQSRRYLAAALVRYRRLDNKRDISRTLANLAAVDETQGRYLDAADRLKNASSHLSRSDQQRSHLLTRAADLELASRNVEGAASTHASAISALREAGASATEVAWQRLMAATKLTEAGGHRQSLDFYKYAIQAYVRRGNTALEFHARNDRALAYARMGRTDRAETELRRCLSMASEFGDRALQSQALLNLGEVLRRSGATRAAAVELTRAADLALEMDNVRLVAEAKANLGLALVDAENFDGAQVPLSEALQIASEVQLPGVRAQALGGLASIAFIHGELTQARELYLGAIKIEQRLEIQPQLTESLAGLSEVAAAEDERSFEATYQRLIDSAQQWGLEDVAARGGLRCGRWYLHRGQLDEAADVLAPAIALALLSRPAAENDEYADLIRAMLEAAVYWLAHQPDQRDGFVPMVSKSLRELRREMGRALRPSLVVAEETAATLDLEDIRLDWLRRENVRRASSAVG